MSTPVPPEAYTEVCGRRIFVDPSDARGTALVNAGGSLHSEAVALWQAAVRLGEWSWVIDIGANYGDMLLTAKFSGGTRIAAVEPNARVLPYLRRTLDESIPEATLIPCAVSDRNGTAVLHEDVTWSGSSTLCGEWVSDRNHVWAETTTEVVPLSRLLLDLGVVHRDEVLIKMDIEGHEVAVLREALPALRAAARTAVVLEVVRFSADDYAWLTSEFDVWCYDSAAGFLRKFDRQNSNLAEMLSQPHVYRRDVVAIPRATTAEASRALF